MAWLLLASTWCLLLLAAALAPWLGRAEALVSGHFACALLLLWARPQGSEPTPWGPTLLATAAGFVSLPAWGVLVWTLGLALGLPAPPDAGADASARPSPNLVWLAHIALAPLFEELLYRERLLPALLPRVGRAAALVVSSALFALPHLEAWTVLATFCVGLFLGLLQLARGQVALCIGYHAGANTAVLLSDLPPSRLALDPTIAALASLLLIASALAWTKRHGVSHRVHGEASGRRPARQP